MEASINGIQDTKLPLKLLLFIDKRPGTAENVQQIRHYLKTREDQLAFHLDVVDVGEQPYLAEHYKLVASPALIKLAPQPQQILAGSDIISQLEVWWSKWCQESQEDQKTRRQEEQNLAVATADWYAADNEVTHSAELMKLSDEIFRLNQIKEELEAQLRFRNRIIAMLAHDLRNPLTAASIAIETLEMGHTQGDRAISLSPELTAQLLKHGKTQIRAIDRMITDILKAAKGVSVTLNLQPQELNLRDLCHEVVDSFRGRFLEKQLNITTDVPQDLPTVYADGVQVRRVVANLLDNAIKYTPEGGSVELMALHRTTQKVQVSVHDTGPGIPEGNREKIFEESYRLERDESKDGYGLGLALCQRIIRAHYGQIWVDSEPGQGSYFYFTLPVYRS